jgi:hypothetical protein
MVEKIGALRPYIKIIKEGLPVWTILLYVDDKSQL